MSFCYVKCQNILVHVLVHLLEHLSFWHRCTSFLFSKLCFIIKVSRICGAGRDTKNLCHKFSSQGPALRILCFRVTCPKFQGLSSRVLRVKVPYPRVPVPESCVSGYCAQDPRVAGPMVQVLGLRVSGLRVPVRVPGLRIPGSWVPESWVSRSRVSGFDFRLCPIKERYMLNKKINRLLSKRIADICLK